MNRDIFRAYDIRGIADTDLTDAIVQKIGQAFASLVVDDRGPSPRIAVGRDARRSSDRIFRAIEAGCHRAGAHVLDLGVVPTPMTYFSMTQYEVDAALQITGSHNPGEYNGFKMMIGKRTLHGDDIQDIRQRIEDDELHRDDGGADTDDAPELRQRYIAWVKDNLKMGDRKLHIALDSGNGVAGLIAPQLLRDAAGCRVEELHSEPDGTFPNHHPDPTVEENLQDLIALVRDKGLDFGVAYDGDGDRLGVVDEEGTIIWGDQLMIIFARQVLADHPGATIIGEVKCSQTLFDDIEAHGGQPIMARVGHSLIKAKIRETGAHLAGEMSGHIFFNDRFFGFDDALYATCRLAEIVSRTHQPFSALLADVPDTFATPEIRQPCDESLKFHIPGEVADAFADDYPVNTIDGARIQFKHGWGLIRASNTQPVIVMRVEAHSPEARDRYLRQLKNAVARASDKLQ